jgi:predicted kinase
MTIMQKTVYLITGPAGVGKSTVSLALAKTIKSSAHINADLLYHMVVGGQVRPWIDNGTYVDLLWDNISRLLENFIARDIEVIVDYIIYPERLKQILKIADKYHFQVCYIVLIADKEELIVRDKQRAADVIMDKRVLELLTEFSSRKINEKFILNTTILTVLETVTYISLNKDRFRLDSETINKDQIKIHYEKLEQEVIL